MMDFMKLLEHALKPELIFSFSSKLLYMTLKKQHGTITCQEPGHLLKPCRSLTLANHLY